MAVSVANDWGEATNTHAVTVSEVALTDIALDGQATAATGAPYHLQATVQPENASWPITYSWEATGQQPQVHNGGSMDEASFTWSVPGQNTVTLAVANPLNAITRTKIVDVNVVAPAELTISGPTIGFTGRLYNFTVIPSPTPLSLPLSYTWQVSGHPATTVTGGPEATASFTWEEAGEKEIAVAGVNAGGRASSIMRLEIVDAQQLFLPFTRK